ncbi:DAK2 domain-containing protein [Pseudonocardia nematodicida]|uniref:DAK2 domain-containing protein n=1 Tax=Pseudonocardia nematodicida TaxID=1206997 RepID=A0ABV1KK14_9PSEU
MPPTFDPALLRRWIDAVAERLTAGRAEIDRINVFPVADHDTGSNLLLTARAAATAPLSGGPAGAAAALAAAAVRGARGNSGIILSQLFRGLAEELAAVPRTSGAAGELAGALRRAAALATTAISTPRTGTALTVLEAAAAALATRAGAGAGTSSTAETEAATSPPALRPPQRGSVASPPEPGSAVSPAGPAEGLAEAAHRAAGAARAALARAAGRPAELVRAGVVDAGGLGLVVVLDALVAAAGGTPAPAPPTTPASAPGTEPAVEPAAAPRPGSGGPGAVHEVTYLLTVPAEGAAPAVAALRDRLAELGDCVAVAEDGEGGRVVHVHTSDAGPAIEAGLAAGRVSGIRVEALPPSVPSRARAVLLLVESPGAGDLARQAGGDVLAADTDPSADDVLAAIRATGAAHVAVLPCAEHRRTVAETAAGRARGAGVEVVVVPSVSVPQGLAALAVHDPDRRAADDVVAMAEAAAGTRTGGLRIAETEALTWAGPCRPGEVLGLADGEVVLIAPDLAVGALWLAHRMLTAGGELVTVLLGAAAEDGLGEQLAEDLRRTHPEVDVVVHRGGQTDFPLVLGVE